MTFRSLLLSNDDSAAEVLSRVFADFQVESERLSESTTAMAKLDEKPFDAVVVDFDDPQTAAQVLAGVRQSAGSRNAVTVGLLSDPANVRSAFGTGANFVLYKPISNEQAHASLRAAIALLKRERRRTFRVPVQVPVVLGWQDAPEVEGIMLDLSEDGMDVLSAQPLHSSQDLTVHFSLSDGTEIKACGQVAWANSNGQAGVKFVDFPEFKREALCGWLAANAPDAPPEETEPLSQCKLTDLSLGGCYVETESPFPRHTRIDLYLGAAGNQVHVAGVVRVMHPGHGMGIEFSSKTPDECSQIENFIDFLSSQVDVMPKLSVAPRSINFQPDQPLPGSDQPDAEDPLTQLLRNEENLSQDDFLAELRRQRRSQAAMA